jgi:hypothetical protein
MKPIPSSVRQSDVIRCLAGIARWAGAVALASALAACGIHSGKPEDYRPTDLNAMSQQTLRDLYAAQPEARRLIASSPGYAVFDEIKPVMVANDISNVYGLAVNRHNGQRTVLRMAGLSEWYGAGLANSRAVVIFRDPAMFRTFVNDGWSMGIDAQAAAMRDRSRSGTAMADDSSIDPIVYHLSRDRVEISATLGARKVWRDGALRP